MRFRAACASVLVVLVVLSVPALAAPDAGRRASRTERFQLPDGFRPAVTRLDRSGRYFVQLEGQTVLDQGRLAPNAQRAAAADVLRSQAGAIGQAESLGGHVIFRYTRLVNAFSVELSASAAAELARRPDVRMVEPVSIVTRTNETSVPFIGGTKVVNKLGVDGKGIVVAVVDTGVDYTHADFNGAGTVAAYEANDPTVIEPDSFPTNKVIAGIDLVGGNYDVLDDDATNDVPVPDPDPLDDAIDGDHGTHVAGTCCGVGVSGIIGAGVAPKAKIVAVKVWHSGSSTADVLVAGYEFAMDPNQDGSTNDAVDVLSFSGGVDYGPPSSLEAQAAQAVVDGGTVFVASQGNSGNQPAGGSGYIGGTPASAPGVIAVAASIDEFVAQKLTVNDPADLELPDGGPIVTQDWGPPLDADLTGDLIDAREFDPPADPTGDPAPTDQILCDPVSADPVRRAHRAGLQGTVRGRRLPGGRQGLECPRGGRRRRGHLGRLRRAPGTDRARRERGIRDDPVRGPVGRRQRSDRRGAQPECARVVERGVGQRHPRRRGSPDPRLRGPDGGLQLRGSGADH